jgi:hypothetical protein
MPVAAENAPAGRMNEFVTARVLVAMHAAGRV